MKQIKKLMKFVAFMFVVGVLFANTTTAEAAISKRAEGAIYVNPQYQSYTAYTFDEKTDWETGKPYYEVDDEYSASEMIWKSVTKMRMDQNGESYFNVYFGREGDYISDVKVNKKGLTAGVTYQDNYYWSEGTWDGYGVISLIAQKAGTYKVSFNVRKADGTVVGSYKMTVYAYVYNGNVWKQAKLGSKVVEKETVKRKGTTFTTKTSSTYKVANNLKSAKFKVTPNKGYSITGLVYTYYNAKGQPVAKKVKNGRSIKLSQTYPSEDRDADGSIDRNIDEGARMYTGVYVSYKDKYLGTYVKYSVVKRHNQKMIKRVSKDQTGMVSTSYISLDYAPGNFNFWRY